MSEYEVSTHTYKFPWRLRLRLRWERLKRPAYDWRNARRAGMTRKQWRALLDDFDRDVQRNMFFGDGA